MFLIQDLQLLAAAVPLTLNPRLPPRCRQLLRHGTHAPSPQKKEPETRLASHLGSQLSAASFLSS